MTPVLLLSFSVLCASNYEGGISGGVALCSLFCASQDDGAIRVWKNFADLEKNPEMVTAWQGLSDMLPTTRGRSPLRFLVGGGAEGVKMICDVRVFSRDG